MSDLPAEPVSSTPAARAWTIEDVAAAYERGKAEGIAEGLERAAAAIEAVSEVDGEFYRRVIFGEDPTRIGGPDAA